jgi:hypothetical protein
LDVLEKIGRINGELQNLNSINITNNTQLNITSPAIAGLTAVMLAALRPFPEARVAVVRALRQIEEAQTLPTTLQLETQEARRDANAA